MSSTVLRYTTPGTVFTDALPLGNGRIGGMDYGQPIDEKIQIDENTFWSGRPAEDNDRPEAGALLPKLREALLAEDYEKGDELGKAFVGNKTSTARTCP